MDEGQASGTVSSVRSHLQVSTSGGGVNSSSSAHTTTREYLTFTVGDGTTGTDAQWFPRRSRVIRHPPVSDGDQVTVRGYRRRGHLSVAAIENHTTGETTAGTDARAMRRLQLVLLAGFLVVAGTVAGVVTVTTSHGSHGSHHPSVPTLSTPTVSSLPGFGPQPTVVVPGTGGASAATVVVPDVAGKSTVDAFSALTALGLFPQPQPRRSTTVPLGDAVGTEPAAGTSVPAGSTVVLLTSCGPDVGAGCPAG